MTTFLLLACGLLILLGIGGIFAALAIVIRNSPDAPAPAPDDEWDWTPTAEQWDRIGGKR